MVTAATSSALGSKRARQPPGLGSSEACVTGDSTSGYLKNTAIPSASAMTQATPVFATVDRKSVV